MMIAERFPGIEALPKEEKRLLVSELCEGLAAPDSVDTAIVRILEHRWAEHEADPSGALTLEEFRKRIGVA